MATVQDMHDLFRYQYLCATRALCKDVIVQASNSSLSEDARNALKSEADRLKARLDSSVPLRA